MKPRVAVDGLIDWSAYAPAGVDCLGFVACMTADQLGISGPKPVVDLTKPVVCGTRPVVDRTKPVVDRA